MHKPMLAPEPCVSRTSAFPFIAVTRYRASCRRPSCVSISSFFSSLRRIPYRLMPANLVVFPFFMPCFPTTAE